MERKGMSLVTGYWPPIETEPFQLHKIQAEAAQETKQEDNFQYMERISLLIWKHDYQVLMFSPKPPEVNIRCSLANCQHI